MVISVYVFQIYVGNEHLLKKKGLERVEQRNQNNLKCCVNNFNTNVNFNSRINGLGGEKNVSSSSE